MDQRQAAHAARGDLHVGDLAGHTDNKGKIGEVKIIQRPITWKNQTASMSMHFRFAAVAIKRMRVSKTEDSMNQGPRRDHGQEYEQ